MILIDKQGGYERPVFTIYKDDSPPITLHYINKQNIEPSEIAVTENLKKVFLDYFMECLNTNTIFFMEYTSGDVDIRLGAYDRIFDVDFPITVTRNDENRILNEFIHT